MLLLKIGAQIIDLMILVIDITKGIQTQTAECLVIGEILTDSLIVVLNKVDKVCVYVCISNALYHQYTNMQLFFSVL